MNILIYRYGSICEPDIISAFKNLNFTVDEDRTFIDNRNISENDSIKNVLLELSEKNYLFIFSINFFPWLSILCSHKKIPYISLIVDSPVLELYTDAVKNEYNRIFTFDKKMYEEFLPQTKNIYHIPLAANVKRTDDTIRNTSSNKLVRYASDISFIGSTYQEKCPFNKIELPEYEKGYAAGIIEAQLKIYGYNFIEDILPNSFVNTFIKCVTGEVPAKEDLAYYKAVTAQHYLSVKTAEQERLRLLKALSDNFNVDIYTGSNTSSIPSINNKGFANSLTEMPLIFNQSKINLNITAKSIRSGLSLRIFDVLGCGGFLITNYQEELPEFFEIGTDLVAYDSETDLIEKCKYYLEHDDERKQIAENGYNKVKNMHTWEIRLAQIVNTVFN